MSAAAGTLGWTGIFRLALVQTALGSIIVLATSTMNRVMVVEMALPVVHRHGDHRVALGPQVVQQGGGVQAAGEYDDDFQHG